LDTEWVCPKCGFTNEYYAAYCVSCSEIRPTGALAPAAAPTPAARPTPPGPQPWPEAPIPETTVLEDAPWPTTRPYNLPRVPGKRVGLLVGIIFLAIFIGTMRDVTCDASYTTTTEYWGYGYGYPSETVSVDAIDILNVDSARLALLNAYQVKWQEWLDQGQGDFPGAEYLVVDELLTFQRQVATVSTPNSAGMRDLYWKWTTSLSRLFLAEQTLAQEPDQANLDARTQAWADETAAYQALYDTYLRDL
jgi:hypothetical protein